MNSLSFFFFTILLSLSSLYTISDARKFNVGGSGAWVPNPPENYESWAQKSRFLVHDTLYFSYAKGADSVLEVNKADFDGCNTKNPIKKVDDGDSEISLDRSGPFYFISGNEDNCKKGQKLAVVVLSVRNSSTAQPPHAAAPGNSPPGSKGAQPPKSSSPVSPTTSPPGSMAPKPTTPVSPATSPPSSAPMTSPPAPMAPESSTPSSAPMTSPRGPMAPESSSPGSYSPSFSPSLTPGESPSSTSDSPPSSSAMGPSGDGPSASGDLNTPAGAPDQKKSSANVITFMSITTVLSLVLTFFISA